MFHTEREIMTQQDALEKTFWEIRKARGNCPAFFEARRFVFMGCGSSYMMAKTAARMFAAKPGVNAYAVAGGDYIMDPGLYRHMVENSLVVFLSRSGRTSEILLAAGEVRACKGVRVASVVMAQECPLEKLSDMAFKLPWAFDESVCQTRTISNFYAALLLLSALYDNDRALEGELKTAILQTGQFLLEYRPRLAAIAAKGFADAVVLAGGVLCGIGEEAALAFTEISMTPGRYHHLLDYRHGPVVLNSKKTLTLLALRPGMEKLQGDLLKDIQKHGGTTVVLCPEGCEGLYPSDLTIPARGLTLYAALGLHLIAAAQLAALLKALQSGIDPDTPQGLDAFISLSAEETSK